jgi:SAM-dependent methyltransferase
MEELAADSSPPEVLAQSKEGLGEPLLARGEELGTHEREDGESQYKIISGYRHRQHTAYFDDTALKDEWQREVYLEAADLMAQHGLSTVYDVGCGSAYKLINYLGKYDTIGFDVEETVAFLRKTYPERKWMTELVTEGINKADLVICADVIEHVLDPDSLLHFISEIGKQYVIFSTPDRNLLCSQNRTPFFGPPENPYHVREWTFDEFSAYISQYFNIVTHCISNLQQGTQMIICQL